jgi:hypothetical protein
VPLLSDLYGLGRFALGVRAFARNSLTRDQALALVRRGMERREATLVAKVERAIFRSPRSPYLKLFRRAGVELGDVARLVRERGVEGTLEALREAGIYVTFDEFKCREPIRRGSDTFFARETDFDNPWITPHFHGSSGGSSGAPTRIIVDLEHIAETAPHHRLWFEDHGWMDRPLLMWTEGGAAVANRHLLCTRFGKRFARWFCYIGPRGVKPRLAALWVHTLVRHAARIPHPEMVPVTETWRISECLLGLQKEGQRPCLITTPSQAIQICLAARAAGQALDDTTFLVGGEPLTPTRRRTIEECGARAVPTYGFSEGGNVGSQCRHAPAVDDIHVSLDAYAVLQRPRAVGGGGMTVDALLLTALRPSCPKVLFNTEIGDHAVVTSRRCGCLFDEVGYHQHLHTIRSFDKLTGVGLTFIGADLYQLMEEILPRRFGGSALDYQIVEQQDARGLPRYKLLVSPDVGPIDEQRVCQTFLKELAKRWVAYRWMTEIWSQSDVLEVKRERPVTTPAGKVFPFRTLGPE